MVGPNYTASSCPTASVSYSTIYPSYRDLGTGHASLAFGQLRTQAGLRPNQILQCAASLSAGGYNQPCEPIDSIFLWSPDHILDGRAQLYSSELSYSYCMGNWVVECLGDIMSGWQNVLSEKCQVVKMYVRQNVKVSNCWGVANGSFAKCQVSNCRRTPATPGLLKTHTKTQLK